ncbi:RDD family protein [Halobacteriales archaeon QS_3_64_16]|nr:MAG: RDD family protein [Halobacteriales archaeon QS_3_64_16]
MIGLGIRTDLAPSAIPPAPVLASAGDRSVLLARIGAVSIDLAICYLLLEVPGLYLLSVLLPGSIAEWGPLALGLSIAILIPLYLTYTFYFEWRYSRTPGKVNRGLVVVRSDGRPCTLRASALRNLCRYVDFLGVPPLVLGVLAAIVSPTGERIGDRVAGTLVVRTRAPEEDSSIPGFEADPGE